MQRSRTLVEPATGKSWSTGCDGPRVRVRTGPAGKEKESEKPQVDVAAALAWAQKEEWARLKKGWVLVDTDAPVGAPRMHFFVGGGYTGALLAADVHGKLLSNRSGESGDTLLLLTRQAEVQVEAPCPAGHLVWQARHASAVDRVLLLIDHSLQAWSPDRADVFEALMPAGRLPASFLDVAGSRVAGFAAPHLVVQDLTTRQTLLQIPVEPEYYGGHSPQMAGALSDRGVLAYCAKPGELRVLDVTTRTEIAHYQGDFQLLGKMRFSADGRWLFAMESYGGWALWCWDTASWTPRADWPASGDLANGDFALDATGRRLAIAHRGHVDVVDVATTTRLLRFPVEHVVKRFAVTWVGTDTIGVRTDQGCASLYAVGG